MVMLKQDGNGAKMPFGLPEPRTEAECLVKLITQWVLVAIVVCIAIGLVGLSLRFARWGLGGSW